ncbi:DUF4148 domain-containing protein [Herbaspirillum sp. HC18]|nr:DUF4148 domain-containing protein [Herbaspirillum sp. HC18]
MNVKNLIAAVSVFAAAGSAFAQGNSEFVEFTNFVSTKTRAEVQAELAQAPARGAEFVEFTNVASSAPRASVAATRTTYDQSLLNREPEFVEHVNIASTRSRADVRQEVVQANKAAHVTVGS